MNSVSRVLAVVDQQPEVRAVLREGVVVEARRRSSSSSGMASTPGCRYCTSGDAAASSSMPSTCARPASRLRYWRSAVAKACWRSDCATADAPPRRAAACRARVPAPPPRAARSAVHQARQHAHLGLAEDLARELGGAVGRRQPAQRAAFGTAGAVGGLGGHRAEAVGLAAPARAQVDQAGLGTLAQRDTSTPGVTANSTWRSCTRSPTA
jgi:hypothetical protein